jgi:hypothetical protein
MKFTRRKFIQSLALVCAAPVINKINGIVSVNVDSCVPVNYYPYSGEPFILIQRQVKERVTEYLRERQLYVAINNV